MFYIVTATGSRFDYNDVQEDSINILDIIHSLSLQCRFNGHIKRFYSVLQHSLLVASLVPEGCRKEALLHDAAEAYIGDIPSPLKRAYPDLIKAEKKIVEVINNKFGLKTNKATLDAVHKADLEALCIEAHELFTSDISTIPDFNNSSIETLLHLHSSKVKSMSRIDVINTFMSTFYGILDKEK